MVTSNNNRLKRKMTMWEKNCDSSQKKKGETASLILVKYAYKLKRKRINFNIIWVQDMNMQFSVKEI